MKKILFKLMMASIIVFGATLSASSQVFVKVRPSHHRDMRSVSPSRTHVWIGEDWHAYGVNYRYSGSYWESPTSRGAYWKKGYWKHNRKQGHQWVCGRWMNRGRK